MIRLELRDSKNHVILTKDFAAHEVRVGRALDCDLVVPDLLIKGHELILRPHEMTELHTTIPLGRHKLRVLNLNAYAQAEMMSFRPWRDVTLSLIPLALLFLLMLIEDLFLSTSTIEGWKLIEDTLAIVVAPALITGLLSVLSRALHGEYRLLKIYRWTLWSLLGFAFVVQNFYGLRWLLPSVFHYREVFQLFFVVWLGLALWFFLKLMFDQLSSRIRLTIAILVLVPILAVRSFDYIPTRKKHRMMFLETPPPRAELFESRPVDTETFLKDL